MSQFSRVRDGSKLGFASLNHHLAHWGYVAHDGQEITSHLEQFGFRAMPRAAFNALLAEYARHGGQPKPWDVELPPAATAAWANARAVRGPAHIDDARLNSAIHI